MLVDAHFGQDYQKDGKDYSDTESNHIGLEGLVYKGLGLVKAARLCTEICSGVARVEGEIVGGAAEGNILSSASGVCEAVEEGCVGISLLVSAASD